MARADGRIEPGQLLSSAISARAWNRAQDAADIVLGVRPGVSAGEAGEPLSRNWLCARAATAINAREWCVVRPSDGAAPAVSPPIDWDGLPEEEQFSAKRAFHKEPVIGDVYAARSFATTLSTTAHAWQQSHVVMSLEPATIGQIIKVQVSGHVFAEILLRHRYHPAARLVTRTQYTELNGLTRLVTSYETGFGSSWPIESSMCGPLKIIWLDTRNYEGPVSGGGVQQRCPAIVSL